MNDKKPHTTIMHFFGVQTSGSSALELFPRWANVLHLGESKLLGIDLPLEAPPELYREAVRAIKHNPEVRGALVTSHKLNVVQSAGQLFDGFTKDAALCGEVSAIYKSGDRLLGHAADPATSGLAMDRFLGADYWQRFADARALVLGAGGAAVALLVYLLQRAPSRPRVITFVDINPEKLSHLQTIVDQFPEGDMFVELVRNGEAAANDYVLAGLPPNSLVVNATGMGKDIPGSPLSDDAVFPIGGAAWELNYRGERLFLSQASRQAEERNLVVEDGWYYFLLGWSTVISYVFDLTMTPSTFEAFASVSERIRKK